jgi:hypothetical protein
MSNPKKKREIWPLAIVGVLAIFISGILYAVTLMVSQDVPMVAEDYYAQELAYQGTIDKQKRVIEDARRPEIRVMKATEAVEVSYPGITKDHLVTGKIQFQRPADDGKDFTLPVNPEADGKQWISVSYADKGLWLVQIDFEVDGVSYYHEENITL